MSLIIGPLLLALQAEQHIQIYLSQYSLSQYQQNYVQNQQSQLSSAVLLNSPSCKISFVSSNHNSLLQCRRHPQMIHIALLKFTVDQVSMKQ